MQVHKTIKQVAVDLLSILLSFKAFSQLQDYVFPIIEIYILGLVNVRQELYVQGLHTLSCLLPARGVISAYESAQANVEKRSVRTASASKSHLFI